MKVFSRLNLTVKAAVKDIPADLREAINKHFRGGMKEFTKDVYPLIILLKLVKLKKLTLII